MNASNELNASDSDERIKEAVRKRYAAAIEHSDCCAAASCCGPSSSNDRLAKQLGYDQVTLADLPSDAITHAFGCGNPLAFANVGPGDVVLDIGSGAGIDVLLAAKIVGPMGRVIGLDFTPEMIARASENARQAGATNVEFRLGDAENMPLEDTSVDWVISNCVINLAPNKQRVFSEIYRVLKPGGQVSIADIVTGGLPERIRSDLALWTGCVAGAIEEEEYLKLMREAGLVDVRVIARQRYDTVTSRALLAESRPGDLPVDEQLVSTLASSIWSARIAARKPI